MNFKLVLGWDKINSGKPQSIRQSRKLFIEPLEERQMLAVTAADFAALHTAYPDLGLSTSMSDYNVIEITAESLSESSLRDAITTAGQTTQNDLILVRTTSESNTMTLSSGSLYMQIDPVKRGSVTIVSLGDEKLTIDAAGSSTVIHAAGTISFGGLNITGGKSNQGAGIDFYVYQTDNALTLDSCIISNNHATNLAGGIASIGGLNIANTVIENNSALNGGGVYVQGNAIFYRSSITNNHGGGIVHSSGMLLLNASQVLSNTAGHGVSASGTSIIAGSVISDNRASGAGGGISQIGGFLTIGRDSVLSNNASGNVGGGIYAYNAEVNISQTTISNNDAENGGGIAVYDSNLNCLNVTMTWNVALKNGGGIYIAENLQKKVIVSNSLVADNQANIGGGIYQEAGLFEIYNVTIAGNYAYERGGGIAEKAGGAGYFNSIIAKNDAPVDVDYALIFGGTPGIYLSGMQYTLIGSSDLYSVMNGYNGCIVGTSSNPVDPAFARPSDFSWTNIESHNYRLTLDSPAIGAGRSIRALDPQGNTLSTDLDGNERFIDIVDMGAYEASEKLFARQNEWIGPDGGDWFAPQNWGYGRVPLDVDEVFIAAGTKVKVTATDDQRYQTLTARSIVCEGMMEFDKNVTGDYWEVRFFCHVDLKESGTISVTSWGGIKFGGGAVLAGNLIFEEYNNFVAFDHPVTVSNMTSLSNVDLGAYGTRLSFPKLKNYTPTSDYKTTPTVGYKTWTASGENGLIDMPVLERIIRQDSRIMIWEIYGGGRIFTPALTEMSHMSFDIRNSSLDLSMLTSDRLDNMTFDIFKSGNVIGIEKFTSMVGGMISISGDFALPNLVSMMDVNIMTFQAAVLSLPLLETYSVTSKTEITAYSDSVIKMPSLKYVEGGKVPLTADGSKAMIYATSLPKSNLLVLQKRNGGRIILADEEILMSVDKTLIREDDPEGITVTLTRTGDISIPLEISIVSSVPGRLSVPAKVTIPAGQNSITFVAEAVKNYVIDGDRNVTIKITAKNHESSSVDVLVQDVLPASLYVNNVIFSQTVVAGSLLDVSWEINNTGELANHYPWTERLYITLYGESDRVLLATIESADLTVDGGATLARSASVRIPLEFAGKRYQLAMEFERNGGINYSSYGSLIVISPELTLESEQTQIEEGIPDGVTFTVTRTGDNSEALEVTVTSSDPNELAVPPTVTIPAGQNSITFKGTSIQDEIKDGNKKVRITVSAPGMSSVSSTVTVLDVPPAELVINTLTVSPLLVR